MLDEFEAKVLGRIVATSWAHLGPQAARAILKLKFSRKDVLRMDELAELAQQGRLGESDREQLSHYLRTGNLLNIMHSRARVSLKRGTRQKRRKAS